MSNGTEKQTWTATAVSALYNKPMMDLLFEAQTVHRQNFSPNEMQLSTLLSIKTGACAEDCAYCSQSSKNQAEVEKEQLLPLDVVIASAKDAKAKGATRFCMGAAWRSPPKQQMPRVLEMVREVKALGLETCMTLGMLTDEQVQELEASGLDYYNHNIDTSPEYYEEIISTRNFQDRIDTIQRVRSANIKVCSGGIVGMGETQEDRVKFLCELANLPKAPESVPINRLVPIPGTPLGEVEPIEEFEFIRTIAVARIMMPTSYVRLSAGRETMSRTMQALCFFAGANSIFYGDRLLTTNNPQAEADQALLKDLGMSGLTREAQAACEPVAAGVE